MGREGKESFAQGKPGLGSSPPGSTPLPGCPTGERTQVTLKVIFFPSCLIFLSLCPVIKNLESNLKEKIAPDWFGKYEILKKCAFYLPSGS